MKIKILGHYTTKVGELWDKGLEDLLHEAIEGSLKNSDVNPDKIEAVYVANKASGQLNSQLHLNALASEYFEHYPPAMRVEGACASGGLAMIAAEQALLAGHYQTVLVVGVEKMTDISVAQTTEALSLAADQIRENGSTFPALYALLAEAHMKKYGTTREQLSATAVKNHAFAVNNPLAQYRKEISIELVNESAVIASPLRLFDCSPISDGASAVVLTSKEVKNKPEIAGFGHAQDSLDLAGRKSLTSLAATIKAGKQAYSRAGVQPGDIQAAEVHDCFTIAEILAIEDLGWFKKGEGGKATLEGETGKDGKIIINSSGGLKAFGHPIGATGVKQIAFLANKLEKGVFNLVLAHNLGGSGATAVVHILKNS
ncbi:MAG: thiolase domain-containing protein [Patescibacteria group bacterium]|nr:thiolase domain-containing protein [Patescibacteria group bacterium]